MEAYKDPDYNWWNANARASDGRVLYGRGMTEEQAKEDVSKSLRKVEAFLSLSSKDQLCTLCAQGRMSPNDQEAAIRLLAKIVLDNLEP